SVSATSDYSPVYLLICNHGGLFLWGSDHFTKHLPSVVEWLDRYPTFKIGLNNEAYIYDQLARVNSKVLRKISKYLKNYAGRFGIDTVTAEFSE
ncbi:MAG: hypothetical protein ACYS80_25565, partial [Planctomycetota bacterium]